MAISIIDRVWKKSKAKENGLLLMLAIADHANEHGKAWPGFRTLQEKTNISNRETITNNLRQLEIMGELIIEHKKGPYGTHWYHVCTGMSLEKVDELRVEMELKTRAEIENEANEVVQSPNHQKTGEVVQLAEASGSVDGDVVQLTGNSGSATEPNPFNRHLNLKDNHSKDFPFKDFLSALQQQFPTPPAPPYRNIWRERLVDPLQFVCFSENILTLSSPESELCEGRLKNIALQTVRGIVNDPEIAVEFVGVDACV